MGHFGPSNSVGGTQFNGSSLLGNFTNAQFQNGGQILGNAETDPMSFNASSGLAHLQHFQNPNGNLLGSESNQNKRLRGGMGNPGNLGPVKLEPQMDPTEQNDPMQQLQAMQNMGQVQLESQQSQSWRGLATVKMEPKHYNSSVFLQQKQQQRAQLQQQMNQQSLPVRPMQVKPAGVYEPGMCARRLMNYMYHQQHRPDDNNIEFWRKFVIEYFAPNAKKRWCVSLYGGGRQTTGVFLQDAWHCEMCNRRPGRGFETTVEVLPRLYQIKYASSTLEELLYIEMPREYQNASGQIVLDYAKAIQESVFEQLRVVRDGQLRIVFNSDLKISSWEFCARRHEELIPRRLIIPQVSQLGVVAHKYQTAAQNTSSGLSTQDLQTTCSSFVAAARQLAKSLEVPLVNDLGYTKRYVCGLQISEVVNSMKDLIDYSRETGTGPMDSLINFPRKTATSSGVQHQQAPQPEEHEQPVPHKSNLKDQASIRTTTGQLATVSTGISSTNDPVNAPSSSTTSTVTIAALHQNSMNPRQEIPMGNTVQIPSASSSSSDNNSQNLTNAPANAARSHEVEARDSQGSMQQILQGMMMSSQLSSIGINGIAPSPNGVNCLAGNGIRVGMNHMFSRQQQREMGNRLLGGLGAVDNFSNLRLDWNLLDDDW